MNTSHEEMKGMSLGGIIVESCKVMYRGRKIFSIIVLFLAISLMLLASFRSSMSSHIDPIIGNYSQQIFDSLERYNSRIKSLREPASFADEKTARGNSADQTLFEDGSLNSSLTEMEEQRRQKIKLVTEEFIKYATNFTLVSSSADADYELLSGCVPEEPARVLLVLLFEFACFAFSFIAMLILTAEVDSAIVGMYASKEVSCKQCFTVGPKIWKKLLVTWLCPYLMLAGVVVVMVVLTISSIIFPKFIPPSIFLIILAMWVPLGFAFLGFPLVGIVFDIALVVTVLEGTCGVKAVKKSVALIKGNILAGAILCILKIFVDNQRIDVMSQIWAHADKDLMGMMLWGIKVVAAFVLAIFVISVHTLFYMRCKSYHGEKIPTATPSDYGAADLEYALLRSEY